MLKRICDFAIFFCLGMIAALPSLAVDAPAKPQYSVQIASYTKVEDAIKGWDLFVRKNSDYEALIPIVREIKIDGKLYYRLKVGPFPNQNTAVQFCNSAFNVEDVCLIKPYNGKKLEEYVQNKRK